MKKIILVALSIFLLVTLFSCGGASERPSQTDAAALTEVEQKIIEALKKNIFVPYDMTTHEYMEITVEELHNVQILETSAGSGQPLYVKVKYGGLPAQWFLLNGNNSFYSVKSEEVKADPQSGNRADRITKEIQDFLTNPQWKEERANLVKQTITSIGVIGSSDYMDKYSNIKKALRIYDLLDETDRQLIDNYSDLIKAEKYYWFYHIRSMAAGRAEDKLRASLKNPASLQVHSLNTTLCYNSELTEIMAVKVEMDYSAQNGFGGYGRDSFVYCLSSSETGPFAWSTIDMEQFYDIYKEQNGKYVFFASQLD